MRFQDILPLVQIYVNLGHTDRQAIIKRLRKLGHDHCQPNTISRCFVELKKEKRYDKEHIKKKREKRFSLLETQLLKTLNNRQIVLSEEYCQKIFDVLQEREKNIEINRETVKILVTFAKKGKISWNALFDKINTLVDENSSLEHKQSISELKCFVDRNAKGNISITLNDLKKAFICLKSSHQELFQCYYSVMISTLLVEKKYLNRSEVVLFLTEEINKIFDNHFQDSFKPREVKQALEKLARKTVIAFPCCYTTRIKKKVKKIYKESQNIVWQIFLDPADDYMGFKRKSKNPEFQLLNRIFITHLHEFYSKFGVKRTNFFHWWYKYGKPIVNELQHELLRHGRRSKLFIELVRMKTRQSNEEIFYQELETLTGIDEQQIEILEGKKKAKGYIITLLNFLTKYFLGANHFRLQKGEYGFIPIYRNDVIQLKFDSYAEGIHMGNFLAIELLRNGGEKKIQIPAALRQREIFMDIFLGELMEACIVKTLVGKTAPRTQIHYSSNHVISEMEKYNVTDEKAILLIITAIKKSISFVSYQQALNYVRELMNQAQITKKLRNEINEIWMNDISLYGNSSGFIGNEDMSTNLLIEKMEQKIDELLILGKELMFPVVENTLPAGDTRDEIDAGNANFNDETTQSYLHQ
ncbi:MAG: hypothetical protein ACFFD4_37735 [Candidatus Odinarchaeota archaeon]